MAQIIPEGFEIEKPEAPEGFEAEAPAPAKKTPTRAPQELPEGFSVETPQAKSEIPEGFEIEQPETQPQHQWSYDPKTYSTKFPGEEYESAYKDWLMQNQIKEDDTYDYRGAFMYGHEPQDGQLPDMWRKPNSPYFTDDSIYFDDLPAQQRAKANTWQVKNSEEIAAAAAEGKTVEPQYELVKRGKMLYESLDTPEASNALSPREVEEAIEFYMSDDNTLTAGDAAIAAAKGLGHIVKQMVWDIPIDSFVDMDKEVTEATERYAKENPDNPTLATFKGLRDALSTAATSFASGTGTAAIDAGRQLSKLLFSIDENVNALETGKARQSDNDTTSLGWTSSDYGDLLLFRQGKIDRDEFSRRFTERHAYNKAFNQTREEMPNPLAKSAYDIPTKLGGQEPDADISDAAGAKVNRGALAAGEFYGYAKALKHPSRVVEQLAGMPIRQLSRGGAVAASKLGTTVAPYIASKARQFGAKLDEAADTLAARGTIQKPTAEAFKSGGSIIKEAAIGSGAVWAGSMLGNLMGMPEVGGVLGTILTAYRRSGDIGGIARRGVERIETSAGLAEAAARVGIEFRQNGGRVVKESLKQVDDAIAGRKAALKEMSTQFRRSVQTPKSNAAFAQEMKLLQDDIRNLTQRKESLRMGRLYMVEGLSGRSIFQHIADKGKEGVLVNGVRKQIDPKVLKLAERLDRKSVRWLLERGIPTGKSVAAMGTANVLMSIGADLPNEALAEAFGMGGLAFTGLLGKGSAQARQNKMGDAARGFVAMHEGVFRHLRETLPEAKYSDEAVYEIAKEKMVELLARMPDEAAFLNAMDFVLANRGRTDFQIQTDVNEAGQANNSPSAQFYSAARLNPGNRPLVSLDTRTSWAHGQHGVADTLFHEGGHGVFDWANQNRPELLGQFIRAVDNVVPQKVREAAEWKYAKDLLWDAKDGVREQIENQLKAEGITDPAAIRTELKKARESYDAAERGGTKGDSESKHYSDMIEEYRKVLGDEYFINEIFADAVNRALSQRDVTQLSKGYTGKQKNAQGVSGKKGTVAMGDSVNALIENSAASRLVEKVVSEFSNSKNDVVSNKGRRKEREKGVRVPVRFGKGNEMGDIEHEAYTRAKRDMETTGFNPQVDIYAPIDIRPGHHAAPGEKLIADNDWGKIFESESGGIRIIREQPKDIKARVRKRQNTLKAYRDSFKGRKGWLLSETAGGAEVFGGNEPPPRFHLTLKSAGYKAEQVNAAWKWMQALKTPGQAVRFWNFGFGTSLNKGSWDKLITSKKAGMVRSQRVVRPNAIRITKKGEVLMEGFDLTVLDLRIEDFAERNMLRPWGGDMDALKKDIEQVLYNWKSNRRGHRPRRIGDEVRPELPMEKKDIINALITGRGPKGKLGKNPFRDTLSGKDAAGIIRTFRLDNMEQVREAGIEDAYYNYDRATENFAPDESTPRETPTEEEFRLQAEPTAEPAAEPDSGAAGGVRGGDGLPGHSVFDTVGSSPERSLRGAIQRSGQRAATQILEAFGYSRIGKPLPGGDEGIAGGIEPAGGLGSIKGPTGGEGTLWDAVSKDATGASKGAFRDLVKRIGQLGRSDRSKALLEIERFVAKDPANYTPAEAEVAKRVFSKVPRLDKEQIASSINWSDMLYQLQMMKRTNGEGRLHVLAHLAGVLGMPLNLVDPSYMIGGLLKEARERAAKPSGNWKFISAGSEGLVFDAGDTVVKVYPLRKENSFSKPLTGMKIKDVEDASKLQGHQSVGLDVEHGDQLDQLDKITTMPFLPGVEAAELRGIVAQGGHLVIRQRKLKPSSSDKVLTRTHEWMENHPNVVRLNSTSLPYSKANRGVTSNQVLILGDDGFLYIVADFRKPNTGVAEEGLRIFDPLIRRVNAETVQEIPELRRKARQLFSQVYGKVGQKMYQEMMAETKKGNPTKPLSIPVGKPQYNAIPDKFWLDPDGKMISVRDWTTKGDHQYAAIELLKKRHKKVFTEDESTMAVTELVKLGYRRGVYDRSRKTVYVNDHSPKWRVTPDQYAAMRSIVLEEMVDVVNENLMTNETKKIFNFNFKAPGASWAPNYVAEGEPITGFESKLAKVIQQKIPSKVSKEQFEATLKGAGVKAGEIEWHLGDFLRSLKPGEKITKDQAVAMMEATSLELEEKVRGEGSYNKVTQNRAKIQETIDTIKKDHNIAISRLTPYADAKFKFYSLDENQNIKREVKLDEIEKESPEAARVLKEAQEEIQRLTLESQQMAQTLPMHAGEHLNTPGGENYRELVIKRKRIETKEMNSARDPNYRKAAHFPEHNPIGHIRFNERTDKLGRRILFIEEIQSDWHGEGRKHGYKRRIPESVAKELEAAKKAVSQKASATSAYDRPGGGYPQAIYDAYEKIQKIEREYDIGLEPFVVKSAGRIIKRFASENEAQQFASQHKKESGDINVRVDHEDGARAVPDAPFKGDLWQQLIFKRMMKWAADKGFEGIAWTTGQMQIDRYDLRKYVDAIRVVKDPTSRSTQRYDVMGKLKETGEWSELSSGLDAAELEHTIGKEMSARAIEGIETHHEGFEVSGTDMAIGGEGKINLYDKQLPAVANSVIKRYGAKVEKAHIKTTEVLPISFEEWLASPVSEYLEKSDYTREELSDFYERYVEEFMVSNDGFPSFKDWVAGQGFDLASQYGYNNALDAYKKEKSKHEVNKSTEVPFFPITDKMKELADQTIKPDSVMIPVEQFIQKLESSPSAKATIDGPEVMVKTPFTQFGMEIVDGKVDIAGLADIDPITHRVFEKDVLKKVPAKPQELWAPDDSRILTEINPSTKFVQLDNAEKREVVAAVLPKIAKNGSLSFLDAIGIKNQVEESMGSYKGEQSPNLIITVDADPKIAGWMSAFIGDALIQDEIYTVASRPQGKLGAIVIEGKELDKKAVRKALNDAGMNFTEEPGGRGWTVIDPRSFEPGYTDRRLNRFARNATKIVEPLGATVGVFRMDSHAESKDTYADTIKQASREFRSDKPLDILAAAKDNLYLPAEEGYRGFFQTAERPVTEAFPSQAKGWNVTDRGPRDPSEPYEAAIRDWRHFGNRTDISEIDPSFHGTGLVGAERDRKRDYPELYLDRSYIGLEGYKPEQGLPKSEMAGQVDIRLLYDQGRDPLNLWSEAMKDIRESGEFGAQDMRAAATIMERKIKEAGYAGYYHGPVAAVFYPIKPGEVMDYDSYKEKNPTQARRLRRNAIK